MKKTLPNKRIKFEGGHSSTSNNLGALRMLPVPLPLPPLERVPEPKQTAEKPAKPKLKPKKRKNKKATTKSQKKRREILTMMTKVFSNFSRPKQKYM